MVCLDCWGPKLHSAQVSGFHHAAVSGSRNEVFGFLKQIRLPEKPANNTAKVKALMIPLDWPYRRGWVSGCHTSAYESLNRTSVSGSHTLESDHEWMSFHRVALHHWIIKEKIHLKSYVHQISFDFNSLQFLCHWEWKTLKDNIHACQTLAVHRNSLTGWVQLYSCCWFCGIFDHPDVTCTRTIIRVFNQRTLRNIVFLIYMSASHIFCRLFRCTFILRISHSIRSQSSFRSDD